MHPGGRKKTKQNTKSCKNCQQVKRLNTKETSNVSWQWQSGNWWVTHHSFVRVSGTPGTLNDLSRGPGLSVLLKSKRCAWPKFTYVWTRVSVRVYFYPMVHYHTGLYWQHIWHSTSPKTSHWSWQLSRLGLMTPVCVPARVTVCVFCRILARDRAPWCYRHYTS